MGALIVAFGALSALTRGLGMLRWLTVMPALAAGYAVADGSSKANLQLALFLPAFGTASPVPVALAVSLFAVWLIAFAGHLIFSESRNQLST